ncbi:MlaD family protein [Paracoccus saliphilus]|uniref:MCE family protein n=1 Tax=Paracoccus saliphilus TaxID=405559 RepID=A0AA45W0H6_9RHOB|nr:MlaD family protein [Paracoccus saliphilus]WCR03172.1 MCE family protein [Paracoccus saliphilus]SIS49352.1 paraquat-inducible protein B [Paracoccus saliphilus]
MSETQPPLKPASPVRKTAVRAAQAGVNVIWLVPILALVVTLGVAWNSYSNRGTLIEVEFADATGITPGETALRFREITVGQVESVKFTSDLSRVSVELRVDPDVAKYIDDEASFWIVRPQVTAQGVTRLDTVLSGAFIEGYWDSKVSRRQTEFVGLDRPPLVRSDAKGSWIILSMDSADGLSEGAPVLYRGVQVGRMDNIRLSETDDRVIANAFIEAPHDKRLSSATVFWDTSGFSLSLGTRGVSFNVNSLSSLLQGGVAFDTLVSGGKPVETGQVFTVQPDEDTARSNLFVEDESKQLHLNVLVDNSVGGLAKGSDVEFLGLKVGTVTDLAVYVEEPGEEGLEPVTLQQVTIAVSPSRMGLPTDATPEDALAFLQDSVRSGLRARVASTGFFGSALMIELVNVPTAPAAEIDTDAEPYPIIPAVEGDISDFTETAEGFMSRIGELPIEEVLKSATDMMNSVTALTSSQDTRAIPESLRKTVDEAQTTLTDIREMVQELRDAGAVDNAGTALASASAITDKLNTAADRLPTILESLEKASNSVQDVDFASIGAQLDATLQDLRDVIGTPEAEALPAKISTLVDTLDSAATQIDTLAGEIQQSGAGANMGKMIDEATAAFESVQVAAEDVPAMVDDIEEVAAKANEIDFAAIGTQVEGILTDLRAMLGSEDAEALPRNLSDTLEAAAGLLNDLRDGNAAGSLNNALDSASVAADEIAEAVQDLPDLITRLQTTAARADAVLAAYGNRSAFNSEAVNMLRELRRATESFGSLARMIERNPRAFILGR